MGPRIDKIMTAVHDATRDKIKLQQVWRHFHDRSLNINPLQATRSPGTGSPGEKKKNVNPATMTLLGGKEELVDGLYLPEELDNWASSMYVLTQSKGRLKMDAPPSPDKSFPLKGSETGGSHSDPKSITRAAIAAVISRGST